MKKDDLDYLEGDRILDNLPVLVTICLVCLIAAVAITGIKIEARFSSKQATTQHTYKELPSALADGKKLIEIETGETYWCQIVAVEE